MTVNIYLKTCIIFLLISGSLAINAQPAAIIKLPDQGQRLDLAVGELLIKSSGKETLNAISQAVLLENPGYATALQTNGRTDISFFVLEGAITIRIREQTKTYLANSFVHVPKGTPFAHANLTNKPLRVFLTFSPSGYEQFFIERASKSKAIKPGTPGYKQAMEALNVKYGISIIDLAPFKHLQGTR